MYRVAGGGAIFMALIHMYVQNVPSLLCSCYKGLIIKYTNLY